MDPMLGLLLAVLAAPFAGALLVGLCRGKGCTSIAIGTAIAVLVVTIGLTFSVYGAGPANYPASGLSSLPWFPRPETPPTIEPGLFGFGVDGLSTLALLAVAILGLLILIYSPEYLERRRQLDPTYDGRVSYYFWTLLFVGSLVGVALSPSLLQMFIFWEFNGLCTWAMISNSPKEKALNVGMKALIVTHIGGAAFLVAMLIVFAGTGSFAFAALGELTPAAKAWAMILLLVAAWTKCAQVPFHHWLPDALESPTRLSSYLPLAAMIKPGVYLLSRLLISGFAVPESVGVLMAVMAMVTIFTAVLAFFRQTDLNRIVAYSAIIGLAYVFVGLSLAVAGSKEGYQGAVLYMFCDAAAKGTLFLAVGSIAYGAQSRKISDLRGLATKMPLEGLAYLIGVLAATGVPPFAGFWPKFLVFIGTLQAPGGWLILVLLAAESVVSFGWLLWVGQRIFLGQPSDTVAAAGDPPPGMSFALIAGMVLCLIMPLIGLPLVSSLHP